MVAQDAAGGFYFSGATGSAVGNPNTMNDGVLCRVFLFFVFNYFWDG